MVKSLKYVLLAICFAGMLGVAFLPIVEDAYVLVYQVFDILKMTLNGSQSVEFLKELQKVMYQYMFKYLILFAIAAALILIASVLCFLQKDEHVYKRSIIYALAVNFYSSCVMLACYRSIETLDFSDRFFSNKSRYFTLLNYCVYLGDGNVVDCFNLDRMGIEIGKA